MTVCARWLARDFLRRAGRPIDIPPCTCPATDCPPIEETNVTDLHPDHWTGEGIAEMLAANPEPAPRTYRDMPVVKCHLVERDISHMAHVFDDEERGEKVVCSGLLPHSVPLDAADVTTA